MIISNTIELEEYIKEYIEEKKKIFDIKKISPYMLQEHKRKELLEFTLNSNNNMDKIAMLVLILHDTENYPFTYEETKHLVFKNYVTPIVNQLENQLENQRIH